MRTSARKCLVAGDHMLESMHMLISIYMYIYVGEGSAVLVGYGEDVPGRVYV